MDAPALRNSVERWLIHADYRFTEVKDDVNHFTIVIKHAGSFGHRVEVFCPRQQNTVLVIGSLVPLGNSQNVRYLKLTDVQKKRFAKKIDDYCHSIRAISRTRMDDGRLIVGAYVVLDREESFNQQDFTDAVAAASDMGEKTAQFLLKTF